MKDIKNQTFDRRKFVKSSFLGLTGTMMLGHTSIHGKNINDNSIHKESINKYFRESSRDVILVDETDVIVCGGGPAGFAAALSAARTGAKVRLFEVHGCLGGVWTAGMQSLILDFNKPGLTYEITQELVKRDARRGGKMTQYIYEIEAMKLLLEEKCLDAGVKVQLFTRVVGAYKDENNRLTTIITESKSGRQAWHAKTFVDATGDGDLGALAGCQWDYGNKDTGIAQPMGFLSLIMVDNADALSEYITFYKDVSDWNIKWPAFLAEIRRAGIEPSYGRPTLFQVKDNILALMINHEYEVKPFDAEDVTMATIRGRAEVNKVVKGLRNLGEKWSGIQHVASNEQIGIREGRRIHGHYMVVESDILNGKKHKDSICRVHFGIDIHAATFEENKKEGALTNTTKDGLRSQPYDIPLRALIAKDVDGLLMAGRCISGDFVAHASYRVTGNAVTMGQAAGVVGALSAQFNKLPTQIPWNDTDTALKRIIDISFKKGQNL